MPYVAIKMFPKDEEMKKKLADKINEAVIEVVGCRPQAVSISMEEIAPEDWDAKVKQPEIFGQPEKMMIVQGEKKY
jgi:Uncharacterized protein, 4-oxalocrotonate tautomerase homolog